jgi:hypothetical protein
MAMKSIVTLLLTIALIALPLHQPRAQLAPAICIVLVAAAAVGGIIVCVHSCQPLYYCVHDPDAQLDYCMVTTRRDATAAGLEVKAGPFKDDGVCDSRCHPTNLLNKAVSTMLYIEKSTDLKNWTQAAAVEGTVDCFEWSETNTVAQACFYRVRL